MSFSGSSTHLHLDSSHFSTRAGNIETRAADMASRRAAVEESVEALLATWRGDAALRFAELWVEWRDNAASVTDSLAEGVDSLRYARDLASNADSVVEGSQDRLRGRLG